MQTGFYCVNLKHVFVRLCVAAVNFNRQGRVYTALQRFVIALLLSFV